MIDPLTPAVRPLDPAWFRRAAEHQARLTMPSGALGRLLDLGRQLCAVQETLTPHATPAAVVVLAADHGVTEEGVSAYPQQVTGQMAANFLQGGAAINILARRFNLRVLIADFGVKHHFDWTQYNGNAEWVGAMSPGAGTANFLKAPAMSASQAAAAIAAGQRLVAEKLGPTNTRVVGLGEMGIGNTTSASALTAALLGLPVEAVTGRGTGLDDAGWRHKVDVIKRGLDRHFPGRSTRPVPTNEALAAFGGLEIAGLVGAALEAARRRMVIVLDGFISSVAGLITVTLEPAVRDYLVAGHRSVEVGHTAVLQKMELVPLLDLGLRLGEGSGAALAIGLVQSAADIMRDMATFEQAGVSTSVK
jgi:nicotinate-nucleotide--dimethylbenzimidazole phosphoribosyltransferase